MSNYLATAKEQLAFHMQKMYKTEYTKLPDIFVYYVGLIRLLYNHTKMASQAFGNTNDERPGYLLTKTIHTEGVSAKVEFVPCEQHPYTGILKTGGIGIIRLSTSIPNIIL